MLLHHSSHIVVNNCLSKSIVKRSVLVCVVIQIWFFGEFAMKVSVEELVNEFKELQLDMQAVHAWCEASRSRNCD